MLAAGAALKVQGLPDMYALITLHRPSNVDESHILHALIQALLALSEKLPIVFPVHPRTRQRLEAYNLTARLAQHFHILDPLGYLEFLYLQQHATVVITDSG